MVSNVGHSGQATNLVRWVACENMGHVVHVKTCARNSNEDYSSAKSALAPIADELQKTAVGSFGPNADVARMAHFRSLAITFYLITSVVPLRNFLQDITWEDYLIAIDT
jgi:hypothetical protein